MDEIKNMDLNNIIKRIKESLLYFKTVQIKAIHYSVLPNPIESASIQPYISLLFNPVIQLNMNFTPVF